MPNIKSAIKRLRSNARKEDRNKTVLSELRTLNKNLLKLKSEPAKATEYAKVVIKRYDQAAAKGIIPKGRADRRKSRIQSFLNSLQVAA